MLRGAMSKGPRRLGRKQAPIWLWAFAVLTVGQAIVATIGRGPLSPFLFFLGFEFIFVWLVLRGVRVVWCFAVLGEAVGVIGPAWGEPAWAAALSALGLALLFVPASRTYVWQESRLRRQVAIVEAGAYGLATRVATGLLWEEMWEWVGTRAVNWRFIGKVALFYVLTIPLVSLLAGAREGSGHESLVIAVLWRVVWIPHNLALLTLFFLFIAAVIRALARRLQPGA